MYIYLISNTPKYRLFVLPIDSKKLGDDVNVMMGKQPNFYWHTMWILFTPLVLIVSIALGYTCEYVCYIINIIIIHSLL